LCKRGVNLPPPISGAKGNIGRKRGGGDPKKGKKGRCRKKGQSEFD